MKIIRYYQDSFKREKINLTRNQLATTFNLNVRDLRPVLSRLQVSTILPRAKVVILNFGFIKAILSKDSVYFLEHYSYKEREFEAFLKTFEDEYIQKKNKNKTPFYLFVFEKIVLAKISQLSQKVLKLKEQTEKLLLEIKTNLTEKKLEQMLVMKKKVSRIDIRLTEVFSAVKEVLDDDEDFNDFATLEEESEYNKIETESILEDFLERIEEEIGQIFRLKEDIEDIQEFVDLKLSSSRTVMTRLDLIATIGSLIFAFFAVIVGLFGTNIKNGYENSHFAFLILSLILIILFIILSMVFWFFFKKKKII